MKTDLYPVIMQDDSTGLKLITEYPKELEPQGYLFEDDKIHKGFSKFRDKKGASVQTVNNKTTSPLDALGDALRGALFIPMKTAREWVKAGRTPLCGDMKRLLFELDNNIKPPTLKTCGKKCTTCVKTNL